MAKLSTNKETKPIIIDKFLGINHNDTGDTQLKLGESGNMVNFYITDDYKLKKTKGYKCIYDFGSQPRGIYSTKLNNVGYLLVASGGKLYYFLQNDLDNDEEIENITPTEIGTISNDDCSFFEFNKKIYILSGGYYSWDGSTFKEVEGYIPLVLISSSPSGGGTTYDEINMLTPKKHQTFNGDGTSTEYHLAQESISSVDKVLVDGVLKELTIDYTINLTTGVVTFTTAPISAMDNVDIYWSKDDGDRNIIENMKYGTIFGGNVDSRVFVYGNSGCKNRVYFSGNEDGIPGVEYFPASNQVDIGPSNFAVTDLTRQYDRLLATTNKPEAYYMTISTESLTVVLNSTDSTTRLVPSVSTYPLNEEHGNIAMGQGRLIDNYPLTIDKSGLILWKATNVRDEKNIKNISKRIQRDLINMPLNQIKTVELSDLNQIWIAESNNIFIYNYSNDTYSRLTITDEIDNFTELNKVLYMSTQEGKIMRWSDNYLTFDGDIINSHWEMNFEAFGSFYLRKTMRKIWVQMQPSVRTKAYIGYITNLMTIPETKEISYILNDGFSDLDFSDFSFQLSTNPQPFRLKMKAKKFTNLKITIDNNDDTQCTITSMALQVDSFGESK